MTESDGLKALLESVVTRALEPVRNDLSVQSRQLSTLAMELEQVRLSLSGVKDNVEELAHQVGQLDRRLDFLVERMTGARTAEASDRQKMLTAVSELRQRVEVLEQKVGVK